MAPTICSEKKPRPMRTNLKEIRRQPTTTSTSALAAAAAQESGVSAVAANGHSNASVAASIINYVTKGAVIARTPPSLRMRVKPEQLKQISDNAVSSSTNALELMHGDISDEDDCEVHSINSGGLYHNASSTTNNNNKRQLLACTFKTVFDEQMPEDKHWRSTTTSPTPHNYCKRYYKDDECTSETYSNMCEIKKSEGLLGIALKTIKLVKRNQMLQRRLAQLQLETSEFIQSVLANPENRHFRDNMQSGSSSPASVPSPCQTPTTTMTRQQGQNAAEA